MAATSLQSLPTSSVDARAITVQIARMMLRMVGSGWQAPQDSLNAADFLAMATSYADLRAELLGVWDQAFVAYATSANGLLSEWEQLLLIPVDTTLSDAERQTRLLAFMRSAIEGTPQAIESAVSAYTGTCTVTETDSVTVAASDPTGRGVFRFALVVPIGFVESASKNAQVRAIVTRMKPAHTDFTVTNAVGFKTDDSGTPSYTDLTALSE